jgi:hypothetical protein
LAYESGDEKLGKRLEEGGRDGGDGRGVIISSGHRQLSPAKLKIGGRPNIDNNASILASLLQTTFFQSTDACLQLYWVFTSASPRLRHSYSLLSLKNPSRNRCRCPVRQAPFTNLPIYLLRDDVFICSQATVTHVRLSARHHGEGHSVDALTFIGFRHPSESPPVTTPPSSKTV